MTDQGQVEAAHVVLAVPVHAAQSLLRESFGAASWVEPILQLGLLSALTIQFELSEPLLDSDRTHFSSTGLCCFAEQSRTTFRHLPGRLSAILYPPDRYIDLPDEQIADFAYGEARALGLRLGELTSRYRVVRHPHDFYAMTPGSETLRPLQKTPVPGLSLAGDYTRQPFVASMEGAVLSGRLAAEAVLQF
jgi:15-cis-phytoene desaturase